MELRQWKENSDIAGESGEIVKVEKIGKGSDGKTGA